MSFISRAHVQLEVPDGLRAVHVQTIPCDSIGRSSDMLRGGKLQQNGSRKIAATIAWLVKGAEWCFAGDKHQQQPCLRCHGLRDSVGVAIPSAFPWLRYLRTRSLCPEASREDYALTRHGTDITNVFLRADCQYSGFRLNEQEAGQLPGSRLLIPMQFICGGTWGNGFGWVSTCFNSSKYMAATCQVISFARLDGSTHVLFISFEVGDKCLRWVIDSYCWDATKRKNH